MAGSYNKITLVGNLTRDPEIKYTDGGNKAVTKFALAVNRKSKAGDETTYFDIIAWERLGEVCNQYLKKGMSVLVEGRLVIRDYTNKDGEKRRAIEVVANEMQMLDSKKNSDGAVAPQRELVGAGARTGSSGSGVAASSAFSDDSIEDEIPFAEDPREYRNALRQFGA